MFAEFCTWCRERVVNENERCEECKSCLKCQYFEDGCCMNEIVVSEYKKEWNHPDYVLGVGAPLCRKYCPYLSNAERHRIHLLFEGEDVGEIKNFDVKSEYSKNGEDGKRCTIHFTPLPKFWLNDDCECITFEVDFNETIYYHMMLLGWCEWDIPENLMVCVPILEE